MICCSAPQKPCADDRDQCSAGTCQTKPCAGPFETTTVVINPPLAINASSINQAQFLNPDADHCNFFPFTNALFGFGWQPLCGATSYEVKVYLDPNDPAIDTPTDQTSFSLSVVPPDFNSEIVCNTDNWFFTVTGIDAGGHRSQPGLGAISVPR